MLDHVTRERESFIIKEEQGFYYKQGVVVHFTLALFETDTLDTTSGDEDVKIHESHSQYHIWRRELAKPGVKTIKRLTLFLLRLAKIIYFICGVDLGSRNTYLNISKSCDP